ncbi:DUF1211 domain-containing protein [Rhodococcus rhodnii]|uniref:Integral membrane protein n=2 Tax=Rhodococcus rhodnii TaxID=38312 RepID=R7WHU7_9NOCA|nr:TMEM175 family protein [Rhodococcus rhodnii]EOM74713.1 hypothetical protein Rrhod_3980 [Rhodococcus rhodnii LMG 5362]TXG88938.1 DUF1211 domain-containing protein [Rhodococcus rhodnii]
MAEVPRDRSFDRYLTFLDAIVAIAITLLVLPLVDLATEHDGTAVELLTGRLGELGAFALSFVVLFRFWWGQRNVVRYVVVDDPFVNDALFVWVAAMVVLPFPSALIATNGDDALTRGLYIGTMLVGATALTAASWATGRDPAITGGATPPDLGNSVTFTLILAVALVLTLAFPATSYYPLLLLLLSRWVRNGVGVLTSRFARSE